MKGRNHQEYNSCTVDEYPVYQDLKIELKKLEGRLIVLTDEKMDCERQINNFNSDYMLRFGSLIEEILKLRATIFREKLDPMYEEAQLNFEEFGRIHHQQLEDLSVPLTDDEKQQLKIVYRKASRLCHPDKLTEDAKVKGEEFFKALNEAYRHQDLESVQDILLKLESKATSFATVVKEIDNRALMQDRITLLYEKIARLEPEIKSLQESEIYQRIQSITNMDIYFTGLEEELLAELNRLNDKK